MAFSEKKFHVICFTFMLLLGLNFAVYQSLIQDINGFFGMDGASAGLLITMYFLGSLFAPVLAGECSDRVGKKMVLILSCIALIMGIIIIVMFDHLITAAMGILLMGSGSCTFEGLLSAKITDNNPHTAEKIMNFSQLFFCVGAVLGPMLSLTVKTYGGSWQTTMLINAVIFLPAVMILIGIPNDKKAAIEKNKHNIQNKAYSLQLIKDIRFILFFLSMLLYVGAESGVGFFITGYYTEAGMTGIGEVALSLFWAGMIIGRLLAGIFYKQSEKIMVLCLVSGTVFSCLLQFELQTASSIGMFFMFGLSMSAIWPLLMAFCTRMFSHFSGTAGGLMVVGASLGGIMVPALMGLLSSNVGVRRAIALSTASMIVILLLNMKRQGKSEESDF